jgi:TorA maturation chaperone TorD
VETLAKEPLVKLQAEYTRLFISGYPKTPCPPYESAYREGRLMGQANAATRALYSEWGMVIEPPLADHLATEFEFLAFLLTLAQTTPEVADQALAARTAFLTEHLGQWLPQFAADLQAHTRFEGYRKLADFLLSCFRSGN